MSRMEDVLDLYHRPFDPARPLVCLDEVPVQLVSEARIPWPPLRERRRASASSYGTR